MKKHLLKSLLALALVLITGNAWGETQTYTMTIDSSSNGGNNVHWTGSTISSLTYNDVTWSTSVSGTTSFTSSTSYCQVGSKSNPATKVTISTTAFAGKKIVSASLTGYCMSNTGPSLTVTAGNSTIINGTALVKTTSTTYATDNSFAGVTLGSNDALTFAINSSAKAAICISEISVTYEDSNTPSKTLESIAVSGTPTKTSYTEGDKFDPAGLVVTGTYDDATTDDLTDDAEWTFDPATFTSTSQTSVSVTAKVGVVESESYNVNVIVTEKPALPSYTLVTDASTLKDGDVIVLGAVKDDTWYVNGGQTGTNKYLDSKAATYTDGILESSEAVEITLEETADGWYLKIGDKYINTTAAKALTFADEASTVWTIGIDEDGLATVAAGDYGRFLYNAQSPRFLNYTSATTVSSLLPYIFKKKVAQTLDVEITSAGFATLYLEFDAAIPSDVTAYTATYAEKTITLHEIEGGVVPAETAVVLKGAAGSYDFEESLYTGEPLENDLRGTTEESSYEMLQGTETDKYVYTLNKGDNGVGFFHMTNSDASKLAANRAYLLISKADFENGAGTIGFRFGDATQIENVNVVEAGKYFDLMGREVLNPAGGIYILNGKKVLVK